MHLIGRRTLRLPIDVIRSTRGSHQLRRRHPEFRSLSKRVHDKADDLAGAHAEYASTVSSPRAAVSLQTAALLAVLCDTYKPERALDLGSGFSTWVIASHTDSTVVTIDDAPEWLAATADFLRSRETRNVQFGGLDLLNQLTGPFDLVFHDLGDIATRANWLPKVQTLVSSSGWLVLDDAHKRHYRPHLPKAALSMRWLTLDDFGRWCAVIPPG